MKKLFTLLVLLSTILCGCNSRDPERLNDTKIVIIDSKPEGATIIVNNLNLGKAPISVEFATNEFGCFIRPVMITALAQEASLYSQTKSYPRFSEDSKDASKAPNSIIFDMTIAPQGD